MSERDEGQQAADQALASIEALQEREAIKAESVGTPGNEDVLAGPAPAKAWASKLIETALAIRSGAIEIAQTGFPDIEKKLPMFLMPSVLNVIAARPAMGKTAIGQNLAENVAAQGKSVLFFSCEMDGTQIVARQLSRHARIEAPRIILGALDDEEIDRLESAIGELDDSGLIIDSTAAYLSDIVLRAKAEHARLEGTNRPLGLIIVDYVQLVALREKPANRNLEVGEVARGLLQLAKDLRVPVIALSQLNRSVEGRQDKRPTMADLRESGEIEQCAANVILMYADDYYATGGAKSEITDMELIVGKSRFGQKNVVVHLDFEGKYSSFASKPEGWRPELSDPASNVSTFPGAAAKKYARASRGGADAFRPAGRFNNVEIGED